jgi:MFS superfamily sulfate permease-like transporter
VVETLGKDPATKGYHPLHRNPNAKTVPGLLIFRFNGPIVFFNAPYFRKKLLDTISSAGPDLQWVVLDAIPVSQIDVTGWQTVSELIDDLQERQIRFVIAGRHTQVRSYARKAGLPEDQIEPRMFPTVGMAVTCYLEQNPSIQEAPASNPTGPTG